MIMGSEKIFTQVESMGHEQLLFCNDNETGLRAIIGVHNSVLGPALGGLRFWKYNNENEAIFDVLRLSRGMTFKASISGLNLGGGKAVIIGDPNILKNEYLLRRFGKFVENLNGKYITAEDVGVDERDMEHIHKHTRHVAGLPAHLGGSGDPSPFTAYGVYLGMKAALKFQTGSESLENKKIVVQGVGKVGGYLVERLRKENATVYIYDINDKNIARIAGSTGAIPIKESEIFEIDADIYSPCALGATITPETISKFKFSLVAGGANNQLLDEARDGQALVEKGILYAPDFLINAGGLINVYTELEGYNADRATAKTEEIYQTTLMVLKKASTEHITPQAAAIQVAQERVDRIGKIKTYI